MSDARRLPAFTPAYQASEYNLDAFITRFQLQAAPFLPATQHVREAAVLVPVIRRADPCLLLTRRSTRLRKHAGQVAFPGGAADPQDASLIATALREAHEEVAIPPDAVDILGTLPAFDSTSGYRVTPVVGLLPDTVRFHPNADEVAELFEMPLREAFTLQRYHALDIKRHQRTHRVYLSWYQQQFVWGLTAAIIRQLALQVA
ncbi:MULTISPECIES: CoA pyrophosphatase [Dickeya]|uniref:Predicted NUDIX hydrolase. Weak 3-phosphohydroxypyruvate phosphatase activity predicted CoA pyrophosphohydrolase n=1 Tax=Dickeya aquatica TaxID=1401087 RepID=A0A375AB41_9GAMM|nr:MULTISPECIES: CoA pyrophosphatase [Dickeya]SLM63332.1 predicted NUDIX hydrolase. Weak 3-phosphohydroxypyruvate phosphatase activity; predicted CoA pyrophosphohydrolase [Dickeya aquatica]